jgi:hypothetical protein
LCHACSMRTTLSANASKRQHSEWTNRLDMTIWCMWWWIFLKFCNSVFLDGSSFIFLAFGAHFSGSFKVKSSLQNLRIMCVCVLRLMINYFATVNYNLCLKIWSTFIEMVRFPLQQTHQCQHFRLESPLFNFWQFVNFRTKTNKWTFWNKQSKYAEVWNSRQASLFGSRALTMSTIQTYNPS